LEITNQGGVPSFRMRRAAAETTDAVASWSVGCSAFLLRAFAPPTHSTPVVRVRHG